ncbi:MAG: nitrite/sulfite reductase, partial [bacterium]
YVGGGLGPTPFNAAVLADFIPVDRMLPYGQAVARVFGRLGEKKLRSMARIKFLVKKLGIVEFKRLIEEELSILAPDPRWKDWPSEEAATFKETPAKEGKRLNGSAKPSGFEAWRATNVYAQHQPGYAVVYVTTPLGDLSPAQLRGLAGMARTYIKDTVRMTVDQNVVFRWVSEADLPAVYEDLKRLGLGLPGANTISDITSCPGTDTCKLGIASSRGLARELERRFLAAADRMPEDVRRLKIKVSGCPNSCGQHHLADLGFYGGSRKVAGYTVPHFNVVLGG